MNYPAKTGGRAVFFNAIFVVMVLAQAYLLR